MQEYIIPVLLAVNVLISLGLLIFILLQKKKSDGDKAEIEILKEKLSPFACIFCCLNLKKERIKWLYWVYL